MSMFLAARVWHVNTDHTTAHFLMALCDIAEDDGTRCYPSPAYVQWKTGLSKPTYYRLVEELVNAGALEAVCIRGDVTEFAIHLEALPQKPQWVRPRKPGRPRKTSSKTSSETSSETLQSNSSHTETNYPKLVSHRDELPETSLTVRRITDNSSHCETPVLIMNHPNKIIHPRGDDPSYAYDSHSLNDFQRWCDAEEGRAELARRRIDRNHAFPVYRAWCETQAPQPAHRDA